MATNEATNARKKFAFKKGFMDSFDVLVKTYTNSLDALNKAATGKDFKSEYGMFACKYDMRYITPSNISTYIGNLIKGLNSGLFKDRIGDVEIFTVASVKKFMEENGCLPFDDDAPVKDDHSTVSPREMTLNDLAIMCHDDTAQACVYSKGEVVKRGQLMMPDIKKINDMHFAANIKKIVNSIPDILVKSEDGPSIISSPAFSMVFERFLEEFVIFACTVNVICVLNMYAYIHPSVEYNRTDVDGEVVTEAYMCKTNDYMIRTRMPFNCNLRDVALQDVTPDFKDLHDALHFIMKDARSPIALLVNKYASKEQSMYSGECGMVSRVLVGHSHEFECADIYTKDGNRVIGTADPLKEPADFNTNVDWLDTITFGNNYLDGNYRKDAVGNNKVHPIMNTLDMIYKMFGGQEYKTSEDLANNIIRNACLMKGIINSYRDHTIENYDLVKDVLVLVGEIITRNMLRLFYNNTPVVTYTDDMANGGPMPILTMEAFVMEADANNQNTAKTETTVSMGNQTVNANATAYGTGVKGFIKKLLDWVKNQLSKISGNFEKNYLPYIEKVKANNDLNTEIADALAKDFKPTINGPHYMLKKEIYTSPVKSVDEVSKAALLANNTIDISTLSCAILGIPKDKIKVIVDDANKESDDAKKKAKSDLMLQNYMLYGGNIVPQKYENAQVDPNMWNKDIVGEILQSGDFVKVMQEILTNNINAASKALDSYLDAIDKKPDGDEKNTMKKKADAFKQALQQATTVNTKNCLTALGNKFFTEKYKTYTAIVNLYNQTHSDNTANTTNTVEQKPAAQTTAQTTAQPET